MSANIFCQVRCWYVYELIDPRTNTVFYIGMARKPVARLCQHRNNAAGSAYARIHAIEASGQSVKMSLVGRFDTKEACLAYEAELIGKTPGLVNKAMMRDFRIGVEVHPSAVPVDGEAPRKKVLTPFDGVLMVRDATSMWHNMRRPEKDMLSGIVAAGTPVKRGPLYPITWIYLVRGKPQSCRLETLEKLRIKGMLKFAGGEYRLTKIGRFVALNHDRKEKAEIARAA